MAKFTYYGGMSLLIERSDGFKILIDPYLNSSIHADVDPSDFYDIDVLLLSHAAFDHYGQTAQIMANSRAVMVCGTESWARVKADVPGIPEDRHINITYGDGAVFGETTVRFVPAWHGSNIVYHDVVHAYNPYGIVVMLEEGVSLYHTGDTCLYSDMKLIRELYGTNIMMPCISTIDPKYGSIMDPTEAAQAVRWIGPDLVIPGHYYQGDPVIEEFKTIVKHFSPRSTIYWEVGKPVEFLPRKIVLPE